MPFFDKLYQKLGFVFVEKHLFNIKKPFIKGFF